MTATLGERHRQSWLRAEHAVLGRVYGQVERRLEDAGAVQELRQLHGMSPDELAVLVRRELSYPLADQGIHTHCPQDFHQKDTGLALWQSTSEVWSSDLVTSNHSDGIWT